MASTTFDCSAGSFAASTGSTSCSQCTAGTYQASAGSASCTPCTAGSYQASTGASTCANCPVGTTQAMTGQTACGTANAYKCWKAKDLKNPQFAPLAAISADDEFVTGTVDVKKPFLFCGPAQVNGAPIGDPNLHQCCYKVKGAPLDPAVQVESNGAMAGTLQVEVKKPFVVCEPCSTTVLP